MRAYVVKKFDTCSTDIRSKLAKNNKHIQQISQLL